MSNIQTGHPRHSYIQNENIRRSVGDQSERFFPRRRFPYKGKVGVGLQYVAKPRSYDGVIIDNNYTNSRHKRNAEFSGKASSREQKANLARTRLRREPFTGAWSHELLASIQDSGAQTYLGARNHLFNTNHNPYAYNITTADYYFYLTQSESSIGYFILTQREWFRYMT